ncbi:MAG TPA: RluA family pseudouridine synthase [Burkholderiales bacterium]|nr:RluA family pseudouridine synthase [Burkholderiales bacterium]
MNTLSNEPSIPAQTASWAEVDEEDADQRIDNFLIRLLKGVPKSHLYRLLRTGQVRVNSRRVDATYRLRVGDRVRLPPVRTARPDRLYPDSAGPARGRLSPHTLLEDSALLVIDKPAGVAVHGGSGISRGVIEQLRAERPDLRFLELVHRLDRDTSGVLLLAKKRSALTHLHAQLRAGEMAKSYVVLVRGRWRSDVQHVRLPLLKYVTQVGERRVNVSDDGLPSHTLFKRTRSFRDYTLLEAELLTGRTHQIRVQLAHLGFPVAGDDKYGDFALNKSLARDGLKRMFLHAARVQFHHPQTDKTTEVEAPLPIELTAFLDVLGQGGSPPTP